MDKLHFDPNHHEISRRCAEPFKRKRPAAQTRLYAKPMPRQFRTAPAKATGPTILLSLALFGLFTLAWCAAKCLGGEPAPLTSVLYDPQATK